MLADLFHVQDHPWTATALIALLAILGGLIVHRVVGGLMRHALRFSPVLHAVSVEVERAASVAVPLIALQFVWQGVPDGQRYIDAVRHVNGIFLIAALTWATVAAVQGAAKGVIARYPTNIADNLRARRIETQTRILSRTLMSVIVVTGAAMILLTFPGARHVGASLLASAGVVGIIAGLAARPVFSNMIAGLQLAVAQPLRIGDALIVKDQFGFVEEITGTYVVLRIWDDRRMIVPLQWFIENPFENWTRTTSHLIGQVQLRLDYATPMEALRAHAKELVEAAPEWDQRVFVVQVEDAGERTMGIRVLVSAGDAGKLFDLRCRVREGVIAFLAREFPQALPKARLEDESARSAGSAAWPTGAPADVRRS